MPLEDNGKLVDDRALAEYNHPGAPVTQAPDAPPRVVEIQTPLDHSTDQADDGLDAAEHWAAEQMAKLFRGLRQVQASYKDAVAWATGKLTQILDQPRSGFDKLSGILDNSIMLRYLACLTVGVALILLSFPSQTLQERQERSMAIAWQVAMALFMGMTHGSGLIDQGGDNPFEFKYCVLSWAMGVLMISACIAEIFCAKLAKLCFGRSLHFLRGPWFLAALEYAGLALTDNKGQDHPWVYVLFVFANYLLRPDALRGWMARIMAEILPALAMPLSREVAEARDQLVNYVIAMELIRPETIVFLKTPEWRKLFALWSVCFAGSWYILFTVS